MDADGTTQFWHWRNVPLLGSFFEDGKESRITSGHVTRDDIPLDTLQSRFIEEDLVWETAEAEVEDDTPPLTPALSMNSIGKLPERPGVRIELIHRPCFHSFSRRRRTKIRSGTDSNTPWRCLRATGALARRRASFPLENVPAYDVSLVSVPRRLNGKPEPGVLGSPQIAFG